MLKNQHWLGFGVVILLVAAALRLVSLNDYPQGFHYDEAVNLIVSREIAFLGARPFPVFAAFNGREVLYYYVNALAIRGLGESIFTMRYVSAMMNLVAIAATLGMSLAMFRGRQRWVIGLLAAALFAVSFPQILLARQAFRAISQPMMQGLTLWTLFVGLRQKRWLLWLALSGVLAGLVVYTYMASRLFPLWYGIILGSVVVFDRVQWRKRVGQACVALGMMLLVALPLINYYAEHRDVFNDRLEQVSAGENAVSYSESIELHLKMFFIEGDPLLRYNQSGQPYFPLAIGLLLLVGMGVAARRIATVHDSVSRSAYLIVLVSPLMVIPSVLAVSGLPPSHMRSIGMVPFIFFLPAIGIEFLWSSLSNRLVIPQYIPATGSVALMAMFALLIGNRYFDWASNPELYFQTHADVVAAGEWLEAHANKNTLNYVFSEHYDHPSLLIHNVPGEHVTFLLGERLFYPPAGKNAYLVETANAPIPETLVAWLGDFKPDETVYNRHGDRSATFYVWDDHQADVSPDQNNVETIGGWLSFHRADLPETVSGTSVTVTTLWHILQSPAYGDFTPVFSVETPEGTVIARYAPYTQHADQWRPGETLVQQATLDIPIGTPPGVYPTYVTWIGQSEDAYVGRIDGQGSFTGLSTHIGDLTVNRPTQFPETLEGLGQPTAFSDDLRLLGWRLHQTRYLPGEPIDLDLYWRALATPPDRPVTIKAEQDENTYILWTGYADMGRYPFSEWIAGEIVTDRHRWSLPDDIAAGHYNLIAEWGDTSIQLGEFELEAVNRSFEIPEMDHQLNAILGEDIILLGYVSPSTSLVPGQNFTLTLYWQLVNKTTLPLTVFVHVVGPDDTTITQQDRQPRDNTYPFSLWVVDEVVDDNYVFAIPDRIQPGEYRIRVGLYLQQTGQRLSVTDAEGNLIGDHITLQPFHFEEETR